MGIFGTGLYSGDFALDLRSTIRAVSRLPFEPERLLQIVRETERAAAEDANNEDHSTFWLVVADQFAKRGIDSPSARDFALNIIDTRADLAMLERLGMKPADLKKREKILQELRARILSRPPHKSRPTLKKPQPFVMNAGDVLVYPTCLGDNINPYFPRKELQKHWDKERGSLPWQQDGWGAVVITDNGRAFDYLAWYRPLTMAFAVKEKPTLDFLKGDVLWKIENPATCSALHYKRIEFKKIGSLDIDLDKLKSVAPLKAGTYAACNDISIANRLDASPTLNPLLLADPALPLNAPTRGRTRTLRGITQILR